MCQWQQTWENPAKQHSTFRFHITWDALSTEVISTTSSVFATQCFNKLNPTNHMKWGRGMPPPLVWWLICWCASGTYVMQTVTRGKRKARGSRTQLGVVRDEWKSTATSSVLRRVILVKHVVQKRPMMSTYVLMTISNLSSTDTQHRPVGKMPPNNHHSTPMRLMAFQQKIGCKKKKNTGFAKQLGIKSKAWHPAEISATCKMWC